MDIAFSKFSNEIRMLKNDKKDPFAVYGGAFYLLTNRYMAIRACIEILRNIPYFNTRSWFSLGGLLGKEYPNYLSEVLSKLTIDLLMLSVGDSESYFGSRSEYFSTVNLSWWFDNQLDVDLDIKNLGKINSNCFENVILIYINRLNEEIFRLEKLETISLEEWNQLDSDFAKVENSIQVLPLKIFRESAVNMLNRCSDRIDLLKEKIASSRKPVLN